MKTLDEIIEREDYKKLNESLIERCIELAEKMHSLLFKLDLDDCDSFKIANITFRLAHVKSRSGYSAWNLYMYTERGFVALDERSSYYYLNDFNCWIEASNNTEKLYFLNHAKAIFSELDEQINQRCSDITTALNAAANL